MLAGHRSSAPDGNDPLASWKLWRARPICFRLFEQLIRAAASRTFCTAGNNRPIRTAMMAMTTSSSMRVNADRRAERNLLMGTSEWDVYKRKTGEGFLPLMVYGEWTMCE